MNAWILVLAMAGAESELGTHSTLESCIQQLSIIHPGADATVECRPVTLQALKTAEPEEAAQMGPA